jgi:integrase
MKPSEQHRYETLYLVLQRALKLQGKAPATIDGYSRGVRRIAEQFDCCPDRVPTDHILNFYQKLLEYRSWSTIKVDVYGLKFFWEYVLKKDWAWLDLIKAPTIRSLPDILTVQQVNQVIAATQKLRYRVYFLVTYSMGLRLSEALALEVSDIDQARKQVHIRRGKGCVDRFVPMPDLTYKGLRALWRRHHHPRLIFPNPVRMAEIQEATTHMNPGGVQAAMKAVIKHCGIKKKWAFIRFDTALPPICWNRG